MDRVKNKKESLHQHFILEADFLNNFKQALIELEMICDEAFQRLEKTLFIMANKRDEELLDRDEACFVDIVDLLSEDNLGTSLVWIKMAEKALAADKKVGPWLECQEYGVDPVLSESVHVSATTVYNFLAELEATIDKGRFLYNHLRYQALEFSCCVELSGASIH